MKIKISDSELAAYGMIANHEIMDNGEMRFRINSTDGSGYARTVTGDEGGWQNSHFHHKTRELFIIQQGWMAMAEYIDGKAKFSIYRPYETVVSQPEVVHNVYLAANTVTHTVKFGDCQGNDRIPYDEFNKFTKHLSEEEIIKMASQCE